MRWVTLGTSSRQFWILFSGDMNLNWGLAQVYVSIFKTATLEIYSTTIDVGNVQLYRLLVFSVKFCMSEFQPKTINSN